PCLTLQHAPTFCPHTPPPPRPPPFPYTTLFRSWGPSLRSPRRCASPTRCFWSRPCPCSVWARRRPPCRWAPSWDRAATSWRRPGDRKSTRLNSSHVSISYAVFCLKKKKLCYTHYESVPLATIKKVMLDLLAEGRLYRPPLHDLNHCNYAAVISNVRRVSNQRAPLP